MTSPEGGAGRARPVPVRPAAPAEDVQRRFTRGRAEPRGIRWFGVRAFAGHIRHFVASAIATEDVDSRDWMTPDEPRALMERVARLLGGAGAGATVTERIGRDLWMDFIADTGDDVSVSRAVARLVFAEYDVPDPDQPAALLRAPRGDILFFGGDTAYPVATADEIRDRVIVPFNQVLAERDDGRRRVLLGIPGNHDWYDGLDGFGRLFRRHVDYGVDGAVRATLHGSSRTLLGHYAAWATALVKGEHIAKPHTLDLRGYTAAQGASYFALPIAPGLTILAVDRQLRAMDARQRFFFQAWLNQNVAVSPWVFLPDPLYPYGRRSRSASDALRALGLTLTARPHLVLSGDIHHYRREEEGPTLHVTAGGGGAFLHPAPLRGGRPALAQWPSAPQSRALLPAVPFRVGLGLSGILPHFILAVLLGPIVLAPRGGLREIAASAVACGVTTAVLALIGGLRQSFRALPVAALFAALMVAPPLALPRILPDLPGVPPILVALAVIVASAVFGAFLFGAYLTLLTLLGWENGQAFTALDHPGYRHFVRLRVKADGSRVDGWCLGLVDPVAPDAEPVLVDRFTWKCR